MAGKRPKAADTGDEQLQITSVEGIPALSLDAISSVAYGPEAMLAVLATAGVGALGRIEPITVAIIVLLAVLVFSYRQVIEAYPDGGGCYAVSKANLGRRASHVGAAALVVDYVLTVAVSIAAGVQALTSAFPGLASDSLPIGLGILAVLTALNLRGLATSARALILPTFVFVAGIYLTIVVGLVRAHPARHDGVHPVPIHDVATAVGILVLLKAFAAGCSALTGVEAIANDVPAFREPRVKRAQHTEVLLGLILATMLAGLAVLDVKFHVGPASSQTVLSQITAASVGHNALYYVIDLSTTVILAIAANTSFGALPVLASLLAGDHLVPHVFALRADRPVYRYGVVVLAVLSGLLLVAVDGRTDSLIPMFAIGVFTGFTLSQTGLVRHWYRARPARWWARAGLNGLGALMTAVATVIFVITKFTAGAWVVLVTVPVLIVLFARVERYYRDVATELRLGQTPGQPRADRSHVVVAIAGVSLMTERAIATALSFSPSVTAVSVQFDDHRAEELRRAWDRWDPGVPLAILRPDTRSVARPMLDYLNSDDMADRGNVLVLVPEIEPRRWQHRLLQNQRALILSNVLRKCTYVTVARVPFRLEGD